MTIRTTPPPVTPAADWRFPSGVDSRLPNGVRVLTYSCPGQYVVSSSLVFDLPLNAEPAALEGVAGLVARCLVRTGGGMSADDFSDALAASGAELDACLAKEAADMLVLDVNMPGEDGFAVARRIRAGTRGLKNWNLGGVHVHHQVLGVLTVRSGRKRTPESACQWFES